MTDNATLSLIIARKVMFDFWGKNSVAEYLKIQAMIQVGIERYESRRSAEQADERYGDRHPRAPEAAPSGMRMMEAATSGTREYAMHRMAEDATPDRCAEGMRVQISAMDEYAFKCAQRALNEWANRYGEWSATMPAHMGSRLPPASHIEAIEAIESALSNRAPAPAVPDDAPATE